MESETPVVRVTLRLPEVLAERLYASRGRESLNTEIVNRLAASFLEKGVLGEGGDAPRRTTREKPLVENGVPLRAHSEPPSPSAPQFVPAAMSQDLAGKFSPDPRTEQPKGKRALAEPGSVGEGVTQDRALPRGEVVGASPAASPVRPGSASALGEPGHTGTDEPALASAGREELATLGKPGSPSASEIAADLGLARASDLAGKSRPLSKAEQAKGQRA